MNRSIFFVFLLSFIFFSCTEKTEQADAYGNFEAITVSVAPEASGKLLDFRIFEGSLIKMGEVSGQIDTFPLFLKKQQAYASMKALRKQLQDPQPQIELIQKQLSVLEKERKRVKSLLEDQAATPKQLDDITGQMDIMEQQISTLKKQTTIANQAILSQILPLESQITQLDDQIKRCTIINPVSGTVLLKLAEMGELVSPARPVYSIANLDTMVLRAYISGDQLPQISLGQEIEVQIDKSKDSNTSLKGRISWISSQAEFTPRTIQTKEERVNQVYAFKVQVANPEGKIKIGMPGEVYLK
ncbi:MAG TPA: HlyD family secretion protein [Saprospirales bacterium]|nr:HlyD family secretion protein [Saprospirales bacterium]